MSLTKQLSPDPANRSNGFPSPAAAPAHLSGLVRRIAVEDRAAFIDLYDVLSPRLLDELRTGMSDPVHAPAIAAATFVEVWFLARYHATADTDTYAWITTIAARRTAELRAQTHAAQHRPEAPEQRLWWSAAADGYDGCTRVELGTLLGRQLTLLS